jgi:hypothetical protein
MPSPLLCTDQLTISILTEIKLIHDLTSDLLGCVMQTPGSESKEDRKQGGYETNEEGKKIYGISSRKCSDIGGCHRKESELCNFSCWLEKTIALMI